MRTEDLVIRLAAEPPPPPLAPGRLAGGMALAALVAAGVFLALAGARPHLAGAMSHPLVVAKTLLPALLALIALPLAVQSIRPGAVPARRALLLPLALALALGGVSLATQPPAARLAEYTPAFIAECVGLILMIAALPLFLALRLLRRGASTRPASTGALAGLAVGALAATGYSFFCLQDNPVFYLVWYGAAIGCTGLAGALAGRRVLAW